MSFTSNNACFAMASNTKPTIQGIQCVSPGAMGKVELQQLVMSRWSQPGTCEPANLDRIKALLRLLICKEGHHLGSDRQAAAEGPSQATMVAAVAARRVDLRRYKTELCRSYAETGQCRYGTKCQFAHGTEELRPLARHPLYRTELCHSFHVNGFCPYGSRCNFIHSDVSVGVVDAAVTPEAGPLAAGVLPTGSSMAPSTAAPVLLPGSAGGHLMLEQLLKRSGDVRQRAICGRMCHGSAPSCGFA